MKGKKKEAYIPKTGLLDNAKDYSIYVFTKPGLILTYLVGLVVGGIIGYIFYENTIISIIAGIICGFVMVPVNKKRIINKRKDKLTLQFKDLLESLNTSIGAGSNITDSFISAQNDMVNQYGAESYIAEELHIINSGIYNNIGVEDLLIDFGIRSDLDDIISFANVFETCFRKGGNLKEVIKNTYQIINDKIEVSQEIKTVVASKKNEQNIMLVMPIVFVFMLKMLGSDVVDLTSDVGRISTTIAIALFLGAYLVGKKILDIKV